MTPYERPTEELRQVRHTALLFAGDSYAFFTVQRKWLVQDGELREEQYWYRCDEDEAKVYPPAMAMVSAARPEDIVVVGRNVIPPTWVVKLKEEWRDLPIVSL